MFVVKTTAALVKPMAVMVPLTEAAAAMARSIGRRCCVVWDAWLAGSRLLAGPEAEAVCAMLVCFEIDHIDPRWA